MTRNEKVAAAVKAAMTEAGIGKDKLAALTLIPNTTLKRRLAGVSPGFTVEEIDAIAQALGVSYADLIATDAA